MTEQILHIKAKKREGEENGQINQGIIKSNIRRYINNKGTGLVDLSGSAHINIFILIYLLYCPFSKIKLSNSFKICKALNLQVSKLLE